MNVEEVIFKKYEQKNIHECKITDNIERILKKSKAIYIYGNIENVSEKEWIKGYRKYIFLQKQYFGYRIVNVYNIDADIYKIEINKENMERIKNIILQCLNFNKENQNLDLHFVFANKDKAIVEMDLQHNECIVAKSSAKKYAFLAGSTILILTLIAILYLLFFEYRLVFKVNNNKKVGIIDGEYSCILKNANYNTKPKSNVEEPTHGDLMLQFLDVVSENLEVYYYDASLEEGKINTAGILDGLNYLKQKEVDIINMSISSKFYSSDIEKWLKENPNIKVFASYNNLANSVDYPAMYESVYGTGKKVDIDYKSIDYTYFTNKIIVFPNIFKVYEGNSYMSLYNAITK